MKAASASGKRLNPRKTDLHRWRETFAEKLRGWGIEAEATRQASRGESRNFEPLWRVKAKEDGRLRKATASAKTGSRHLVSRAEPVASWAHIMKALTQSDAPEDHKLADRVATFVRGMAFVRERVRQRAREEQPIRSQLREQELPGLKTGHSEPDRSR